MSPAALAVHRWPDAPARLVAEQNLLLVAVDTPETPIRAAARQRVRQVLREILAPYLACTPAAVPLLSQPGQAPSLAHRPDIGLSISHERGLSLVAIHFAGPVGVDLMRLPDAADWTDEMATLAGDYLGITLAGHSPAQRLENFTRAWTAHEARMKCLGRALEETNPELQQRLAQRTAHPLDLPAGFVGYVAT